MASVEAITPQTELYQRDNALMIKRHKKDTGSVHSLSRSALEPATRPQQKMSEIIMIEHSQTIQTTKFLNCIHLVTYKTLNNDFRYLSDTF